MFASRLEGVLSGIERLGASLLQNMSSGQCANGNELGREGDEMCLDGLGVSSSVLLSANIQI